MTTPPPDRSTPPTPTPPGRTRWTLRARLIGLVVAVAAAVLVAVDVLIPVIARSALISTKDQTLTAVVADLRLPTSQTFLENLSEHNPLAGEVGWSVVTSQGTAKVLVRPPGYATANPLVGAHPPEGGPVTVRQTEGHGTFRILARGGLQDGFGEPIVLVAWIPLDDVSATVGRLIFSELIVSAALLVLVGAIASLVIRRELRPLEAMARVADEIATGDVSLRVDPGPANTEVGRLGTAFNGMVDGVSSLLAEREASEARMRQFVADASHELRTPVAAIRGYTDLYRAGALTADTALERAMDRMGFESRRMSTLVEDLLTLSQTDGSQTEHTEPVPMVPLLAGVIDDAAVIDRERTWRLAGADSTARVRGVPHRLHQLFANLLANVRTHTPPGTTATVTVAADDDHVQVCVIDDGPGVDAQDLPHLFDRFYRADKARSREQGGSGLGLSIAAAITRGHGGHIAATATPGGGLTVTVTLPQAPAGGEATDGGESTGDADASSTPPERLPESALKDR